MVHSKFLLLNCMNCDMRITHVLFPSRPRLVVEAPEMQCTVPERSPKGEPPSSCLSHLLPPWLSLNVGGCGTYLRSSPARTRRSTSRCNVTQSFVSWPI